MKITAGMTRLQRLDITRNDVSDLMPLSGLPATRVILATDNQVSSLDGVLLPKPRCGSELDFRYNPIGAAGLAELCAQNWVTSWGTAPPQACNAPCLQ